jgi:hypothetical protein
MTLTGLFYEKNQGSNFNSPNYLIITKKKKKSVYQNLFVDNMNVILLDNDA